MRKLSSVIDKTASRNIIDWVDKLVNVLNSQWAHLLHALHTKKINLKSETFFSKSDFCRDLRFESPPPGWFKTQKKLEFKQSYTNWTMHYNDIVWSTYHIYTKGKGHRQPHKDYKWQRRRAMRRRMETNLKSQKISKVGLLRFEIFLYGMAISPWRYDCSSLPVDLIFS